jgi:TolB-like protein
MDEHKPTSFFAELRRRNVIRMAGLYLVGAWLLVQVSETVLPAFDVPGWVLRAIIIVLALGFVPAVVFAWIYELTPEGIRREQDVERSQSIVDHTARRLDIAVIVLLLGVGAMMFWQARRPAAVADMPAASPVAAGDAPVAGAAGVITDKSIAVLPFADFSAAGDQAWFADGLAEEVLNALARTPDLMVSARTSSFRYKDSELAIPDIARELGVAHVLEGSVRSTPTRVRVTAQLIRASDGFHLWSQTYDRDIADMIEVQEDLAQQIALAMQTSMDPAALAAMASVGTRSVEAYQAYIRGVAAQVSDTASDAEASYSSFERARALDPAFAAAHAQAADFWLTQLNTTRTLSGLTEASPEQAAQNFSERIDLAIAHAATATDRLEYRALKAQRGLRLRESIELNRAVLAERPGDVQVLGRLLEAATYTSDHALGAEVLDALWRLAQSREEAATIHANAAHRHLDKARAADLGLELLERWPNRPGLAYQVHRALLWDRRVEQAGDVLGHWRSMADSSGPWVALPPARQACAEGRRADVEAALDRIPPGDISERWHLLTLLGRTEEAVAALQPLERDGNTYALAGYLSFPEFDPSPFPSLVRVLEREKVRRPAALALPFACPPAVQGED